MFSYALVALAVASRALAAPEPIGAAPKSPALGQCDVKWTADTNTTVPWTEMNIEFMTGNNQQMTHMRTIATVDATTTTSFSWVCPDVDLYSEVYFYQFSSPADPGNLVWVTRWTMTGTDGSSVPAPEIDDDGVGWGVGHFKDPSLYNAMPAYLNGNGQLQGAPGNGTTTSPSGTTSSGAAPTGTTTSGTAKVTPSGTSGGSSTIATVTKGSSTGTNTASHTSTASTTASSGGASALSSSSLATMFGALMAGVAAFSL